MNKKAIIYGVAAGLVVSVITLLAYLTDKSLLANWWFGMIMLPIPVIAMVMAGIAIRKEKGSLPFGEAFLNTFITGIVFSAVSVIFQILLYHAIDPELPAYLMEKAMENTAAMMEKFGVPESQMDIAMEEAAKSIGDAFTVGNQLMSVIWSAIVWGIVALIIAAIIKRNPETNSISLDS